VNLQQKTVLHFLASFIDDETMTCVKGIAIECISEVECRGLISPKLSEGGVPTSSALVLEMKSERGAVLRR
jgi:hypothetical protein